MKLGQYVYCDEILNDNEMGQVGSKTMSLCQILEKSCARSSGHIFSPMNNNNDEYFS